MQWILRFRVYVIICLAVVLISAAVVFSVLRAVLPYATGYKNEIQQEISEQIGLPIKIDGIDAAIHWFSPRLKLINVVISDTQNKAPLFRFEEIFVELDVVASVLRQELIVDNVGLIGVNLSIEKISENEWTLQGISIASEGGSSELPEKLLYMLVNSDYLLHDSNIHFRDHTKDNLNINLLDVNIDVENNFNNHDIKFSMGLPGTYGRDIALVANLRGEIDSLQGDVYIEAHQLNVKQWNKKFKFSNRYQLDAILDIDLWINIDSNVIKTLHSQIASENFSIKNNQTNEGWSTRFLSSDLRYVYGSDYWNITVSDLFFGEDSVPDWQRGVNIFISEDRDNYTLSADFLRFSDLHNMADVFLDNELLADSNKLKSYEIQSDVYNLNLQLAKDVSELNVLDKISFDATVVDFSMHDYKNKIRVSGFDSSVHYDNHQASLDVASNDTELEITDLFKKPIFAKVIQGQLLLDHENASWQLSSEKLQVKNEAINTFTRLDIRFFEEDIFTDIHTDFYDGKAEYVSDYLPIQIMSQGLIDWLDAAVNDGAVTEGEFILHGDLKAFPFDDNNGAFQVLFSAEDVNMLFLEDWPLLKDASAKIKFDKKSLIVKAASGETQGARLFNSSVVINDLTAPHLTVSINAETRGDELQSYIWNSPLDETLGDAMRLFQVNGRNELKLELQIPLDDENTDVTVDGRVSFVKSEIYYPELGYELNDINGVLDFTKDSVFADAIKAKVQGETVFINASTKKEASQHEMIFNIEGVLPVDYLLQSFEWLPQDWFSGKSKWLLDIHVPYAPQDTLVRITANTDLEGVVLQVSDKLYKPKPSVLHLSTSINVLDEKGLHVNTSAAFNQQDERYAENYDDEASDNIIAGVDLKNVSKQEKLFDFSALRDGNKVWNFDIKSDYILGQGEVTEGLSKDSIIKLDLKNIDLYALMDSQNKKMVAKLKPGDVPPLKVKAETVSWNDLVFTDVNLVTDWHKHGMLINTFSLKGPSMTFDARGTWLNSWRNSQETVVEGVIGGDDLGKTLAGLGFEKSINRSKYDASFSAKWPAEPYAVTWGNVKGDVSFKMSKGQIVNVDPGSGGRLLGLLNIFKLANRLVLDFTDVTRDGFSFDSISGKFNINNGQGNLEKFNVSASAADVTMLGGIGLLDRDYDLLMSVRPHTDTLTFAGGVLLGGVVVGAGLAIIQKLFDFGIVVQNIYSITGSWDNPTVEKIIEKTQDTDANGIEDDEDDF